MSKADDLEYQDYVVEDVTEWPSGWTVGFAQGLGCSIPKVADIVPHVGDTLRLYGTQGAGGVIRGIDVNGRTVYYRTWEEHHAWVDEQIRKEEEARHAE